MIKIKTTSEYWTKEMCHKESLKYKTRSEYSVKSQSAYKTSRENKWLDDICKHMIERKKPSGHWTKENCHKEALKYKTRIQFRNNSRSVYSASSKNKWLKDICKHMVRPKKIKIWTKEKCQIEALKYKKRSEFKKNSGGAYNFAIKNGILDEMYKHMKSIGNRFKRLIYVYEFEDKCVYVGLTYNIEERDNKHKRDKDSSVYKHIKKTRLIPKLTYTKYIHVDKARVLEGETVKKYKNNGYTILNKAKTGIIGGSNIKWTFEKCLKIVLECKSRSEFSKKNNSAYNSARRYGWLDKVCSHIEKSNRKPLGYWTKENCFEEALKYNSRNKLYVGSNGAYSFLLRNGLLNDACCHMIKGNKKPNGYWTKEKCLEEFFKYESRSEFCKKSGSAYTIAIKNGWLN